MVDGSYESYQFFFFKQKTAYEMRISDWSSDVCSSDLHAERMVDQAVAALVNSDAGLAEKVIRDDAVLDEGQREIDDKAILIIAKRQIGRASCRERVCQYV